jgi:hypothetical protein
MRSRSLEEVEVCRMEGSMNEILTRVAWLEDKRGESFTLFRPYKAIFSV